MVEGLDMMFPRAYLLLVPLSLALFATRSPAEAKITGDYIETRSAERANCDGGSCPRPLGV